MPPRRPRNNGDSREAFAGLVSVSNIESKPVVPRDRSLEEFCEGDPHAEHIEFTHDVSLDIDSLKDSAACAPLVMKTMPLYHASVLWSLVPLVGRLKGKAGPFELSLINTGAHMGVTKGGQAAESLLGPNEPKAQRKPDFTAGSVTFLSKWGKEIKSFELEQFTDDMRLSCVKRFTRADLGAFADGTVINLRLRVIVARSYFDVSKQLIEPTTVPESKRDLVKQILRGEKPPSSDWSITVVQGGSGDREAPLEYFVHANALASVSDIFKKKYASAKKAGTFGFYMPFFEPDDMPVVISIIYGLDAPLPTNFDRVGKLGRALTGMLNWPVLLKVFAQWELAIYEKTKALDKHDKQASCRVINDLLTIVWCCPLGSIPTAKRVAVAALADMIWLHAPAGVDVRKRKAVSSVFHRMLEEGYVDLDHIDVILDSVHKHISRVTTVRKVGLPSKNNKRDEPKPALTTAAIPEFMFDDGDGEVKEESPLPMHSLATPTDERSSIDPAPTVVAIENDDDEDNGQEEEEEPTRATAQRASFQCAIS